MNKIIVLCIIICGISACSKDNSSIGKCVFRYNQPNTITSLDPAFARNQSNIWAIDHIYNTLVQLDDSLHLQPCLAKSWTIDDEGKKYQFILNTRICFQDDPCFEGGKGRSINASDVVYSLNRIIDEKVASPGSWIFSDRIDSVQPFVAINDSTVEIRLKTPFMPFLQLMSMQYCSIVPHEAVEKYGKLFREHPVGTGPFQLKKWVEGQTMILDKNPNYFEKLDGQQLPFVDIVRISFIGDKKTAFLQLLEGNLDFMSGFDPSMANELLTRNGELRERYADKILCYKSPYLNTEYLGVNLEFNDPKSPLLNKYFRQALNYGFDRKGLLATIKRGIGSPATSSFPPYGLPSFDDEKVQGYYYDINKAKDLLVKSGFYKLKVEDRPVLNLFTAKDYSDHCLYITKQWEQLGIKCNIELAESATVREMMRNGQALFFRGSWLADYPDAENYLTVFYGGNPAPPNYTHFKNADYDQLYKKSLVCIDEKERYSLYHQMEKILLEESPVILMYYDAISNFTSKNILDYRPNALNLLKVKYIKKSCQN